MAGELSDVQVVALSKAMGEARVKAAREQIANGRTEKLDFTVRITGTLTRGPRIADTTKLICETLEVDWSAVLTATLKKLGVKRADFDAANQAAEQAALKRLAKQQAALKPTKVPVRGRDGDINVVVDVVKV